MKKFQTIYNIVLLVAAIALFVLYAKQPKSQCPTEHISAKDSVQAPCYLPVAYINVDSLLLHYAYSIDLNEQLMRKRENSQANFNQKARQLDQEVAEFERKLQNNAFLSQQRAQSEQERLIKKQQDLQALDQRLSNELAVELQKMNAQLQDSIYNYLKEYNALKGFHLIFSNSGNDNIILAQEEAYDITDEVVEALNARYAARKTKK